MRSYRKHYRRKKMVTRLIEAGYSKSLRQRSLSDREEIVSTLLVFHLFLKVKAVMDQFRKGLDVAAVYGQIQMLCAPCL